MPLLPEVPKVELDVVANRSTEREGFLSIKRYDVRMVTPDAGGADGTPKRSSVFRYDLLDRRALDAAVIAAHYVGDDGVLHVYLRSAIRPPVSLARSGRPSPVLWELPAGLIEPGEEPHAGAARELEEELGFAVEPSALQPLGPTALPAPAFIGEEHWFFHVRVDPGERGTPGGDGSPLEEDAHIIAVPLTLAIEACRAGEIRDSKTELALYRLQHILAPRSP